MYNQNTSEEEQFSPPSSKFCQDENDYLYTRQLKDRWLLLSKNYNNLAPPQIL